jgi:hypothetical protein
MACWGLSRQKQKQKKNSFLFKWQTWCVTVTGRKAQIDVDREQEACANEV